MSHFYLIFLKITHVCIENKGTDQLHGYREADLCLCFRMCKTLVFSLRNSNAFVTLK